MRPWLTRGLLAALLWFFPSQSFAQATDAGITFVGLASIQPIDDAYVGGPYLSEGIGGIAPGFGAGGNVILSNGFTIAGEYSMARFEQQQSGRLVLGGYPNEGIPAITKLHDSLLSGLIGYATGAAGRTRTIVLGGVSAKLDRPTVNGVEREDVESEDYDTFPVVFTGGVDVIHPIGARASLMVAARYSFVDRKENLRYLGIGPDVIRVGVGLRIQLN